METTHQKGDTVRSDLVSMLEDVHRVILGKLDELEKLALNIERVDWDAMFYMNLFRLNNYIYTALIKQFNVEQDYLYGELQRVVPDPASLSAIESEHLNILRQCNRVQNSLGDRKTVQNKKEQLRRVILQLIHRVKVSIKNDEGFLHHEINNLLNSETRTYVHYQMRNNSDWFQTPR